MGRRRTVRELQRQLQYAQARESYNPPLREAGSATQRRPKVSAKYHSLYADTDFTIQVPQAGLQFFGGRTAVGLAEPGTDPRPVKGFRPNTIFAMVADASPQTERARGSNRPYTRYARGSRGSGTQSNFSCAFQDPGSSPTATGTRNKFDSLSNSMRDNVGGAYGRIWAEFEQVPIAESGV
jgi:hypothetical protein